MLGIRYFIAAAWLSIAPLAAVAATAPASSSPGASAIEQNQQQHRNPSTERSAQFDAARTQPSAARRNPQPQAPAEVYLMRGFLNVFSLGMDELAAKLQAEGIAASVTNHADADIVTSRIVSGYNAGDRGPIILIGHSLGADAIVEMADALARQNIPVALMVLFDGTAAHQIPPNVAIAVNYTKHFMIAAGPGSRAAISNVDLSGDAGIDHLSIDRAPPLQAQTMQAVRQAAAAVPAASRHRRR